MRKLGMVIFILVVFIIILILAKNLIAKTAISAGVRALTGMRLSMKSMKVGVFKTRIEIKDLKLYNPKGFKDELMVDMPEIFVDYSLGSLLKGKAYFREIRLNLKEFIVVKNDFGELNLDSLKVVKEKKQPPQAKEKKKAEMPELKIDELQLVIGKVIYKDYYKREKPSVRIYHVNINEKYKNITDPRSFVSLVVVKALMNTGIAALANFDIGPLMDGLKHSLKTAGKIAADSAGKIVDTGIDVGKKVLGTASGAIDKTTNTIKKILPLGN